MKKYLIILAGFATAAGILLAAAGAWFQSSQPSVAVIGGADGPTSIFIAAKVDGAAILTAGGVLIAGALTIGLILVLIFRRKRK